MPHVRLGNVTLWDDGASLAGENWSHAIWRNFEQAEIIILVLSPAFISSEFCYEKELALAAHEKGEKVIFPVRMQQFASPGLSVEKIQGAPSDWIFQSKSGTLDNDLMIEAARKFNDALTVVKKRKLERVRRDRGGILHER